MVGRKAIPVKIIGFFTSFILSALFALTPGCKDKEDYQKEISRRGMSYSADSFLAEAGAGNKELIELFLKAGMDVNAKGSDGNSALHMASAGDNFEVIELLVQKGADVNAQGKNAYTALMVVSSKGNLPAAKLFLKKGADVNARNSAGETALMLAALNGSAEMAELLIEHGADVNAGNDRGITVLGYSFLDSRMSELLREAGAKK
jgi:cytohesin